MSRQGRGVLPVILALALVFGCISATSAQSKIDLQACEDIKVVTTQVGIAYYETATCIKPSKVFQPRGTLSNVHLVATFPAVPTGAGITFLVTKNDANGEHVHSLDYAAGPKNTTAYAKLTINTPGKYFVRMVNYYDRSQVWATTDFTVGEDKVGPRSAGNTASGGGVVSICKTVDDDWNCAGGSREWQANKGFDVLFKNPTPVGVDFIGIVFYRQGPDGKDAAFVNEYQQNIGDKNRYYATMNNELSLPAGTYSVYVIAWDKRETMMKNGNLTEYFAKTTLTVK